MEIITRNGAIYDLTAIPDDELEAVQANNEEVIESFTITAGEKAQINGGSTFTYIEGVCEVTETPEYLEQIKETDLQEFASLEAEQKKAERIYDNAGKDKLKLDCPQARKDVIDIYEEEALIEKNEAERIRNAKLDELITKYGTGTPEGDRAFVKEILKKVQGNT